MGGSVEDMTGGGLEQSRFEQVITRACHPELAPGELSEREQAIVRAVALGMQEDLQREERFRDQRSIPKMRLPVKREPFAGPPRRELSVED